MAPTSNRKSIIKILIWLFILVLVVLLLRFLLSGKIIVTTNNPSNTITLTKQDGTVVKTTTSELTARLGAGTYIAKVSGSGLYISRVIKLGVHQTQRLELDPPNLTSPEPVAKTSAQNLVADNSQLRYLDPSLGVIVGVDDHNNTKSLSPGVFLNAAAWADPTYGVAQDDNNGLHIIDGTKVTSLRLPSDYNGTDPFSFAITKNRQVYVSYNGTIYSGNASAPFKQIYTTKDFDSLTLFPQANEILAVGNNSDQPSGGGTSVLALNVSGKLIKSIKLGANDDPNQSPNIAWAPDGQHVVISDGSATNGIYDTSLKETSIIPADNAANLTWVTNDTVAYTSNSQLWTYDITTSTSVLVANLGATTGINEVDASADGSYIYLISGGNNQATISKIGLKNQSAPPYVYLLNSYLPTDLDSCSISFLNFAYPAVIMHIPLGGSEAACQAQTKAELKNDAFKPDTIKIQAVPGFE